MTAANKRKGASHEIEGVNSARERLLVAERLRLNGVEDHGDFSLTIPRPVHRLPFWVVECKNSARFTPGPWMDEAVKEARAYGAARAHLLDQPMPAVLAKRRGKGVRDAFFIQRYGDVIDFWGDPFA